MDTASNSDGKKQWLVEKGTSADRGANELAYFRLKLFFFASSEIKAVKIEGAKISLETKCC